MVQDLPQTFNPPLGFLYCLSPCQEHCSLRSEWNYLLLFCLFSSGWARMTMWLLPMAPCSHVVSPLLDSTVSVSICLVIRSVTWTIYVLHKHQAWALHVHFAVTAREPLPLRICEAWGPHSCEPMFWDPPVRQTYYGCALDFSLPFPVQDYYFS